MIAVSIPSPRSRLGELLECLAQEELEGLTKIVVTTLPDPILESDLPDDVHLVLDETPGGVNFSRWCNLGLDSAASLGATETLNMNSDIRLYPGAVAELKAALRGHNLSMVGVDFFREFPGAIFIHKEVRPYGLTKRVSAACFMTPTEQMQRFDEEYEWHYETDDFEYECRLLKGTAIVGTAAGYQPIDTPLGSKVHMANLGRKRFTAKWGTATF